MTATMMATARARTQGATEIALDGRAMLVRLFLACSDEFDVERLSMRAGVEKLRVWTRARRVGAAARRSRGDRLTATAGNEST